MSISYHYGTGRRKSSVARVFIKDGKGKIKVNNLPLESYFSREKDCIIVKEPLQILKLQDNFDIKINVHGGGSTGQSSAIRLGISRALVSKQSDLKSELRGVGFLTRDSRKVERKKVGLRKARRKRQFSKR